VASKRKEPPVKKEKKSKGAKAAPKAERSGGKGKVLAVVAALLLCAVYAALCASVNPEQVLPKTRIVYQTPQIQADISAQRQEQILDLSGFNREGALRSLEEDFHSRYDGRSVTVKAADSNYVVPVGNTLRLDTEDLADLALAPSQVPFPQRGLSRIRSLFTWRNMAAQPEVENESQLRENLRASGLLDLDTTVQTTYEVKDKQLVLHKGKSGESVDEDALVQQISDAVLAGAFDTPVDSAMKQGEVDQLDWAAVEKQVCTKPRNASLKLSDDRRDYQIVDAVTGVSFDQAAAQQALSAAQEGTDVAVELKYKAPEITTKRMKNKLFKHLLGTYTTGVSGTWNRISNVRLAAEKCNGIILCKGDEFSYNETLGQRTEANGFKTAGAYLNGTTVQELGGGICQISSTMYAAVLQANLKIVERHNHTFASSYIGLGMDATVSWGGPDFRFKNDKDYPIKIESYYADGYAVVKIWGTRTDKITVEMVSETKETIPYPTDTREDDSMYEGERRVSQSGSDGYRVQTYRKVYDDGKLISSEKETYNVYKPHEEIVYVGTKKKEPEESQEDGDSSKSGNNQTEDGKKKTSDTQTTDAAQKKKVTN
jgi:vancomycin resistance protein YoaR